MATNVDALLGHGTVALDTAQRFYPSGALQGSLRTNYRASLLAWLTPEEEAVYDKLYPANSYRGPTNWYKMRAGKVLG
ncbi:MAG: hypothetical protein LQ340_001354 [Diploschistes diacapsis]|nr:MAG: hypothetical protein LQ340_001354 [Diploschistes diacapsis]